MVGSILIVAGLLVIFLISFWDENFNKKLKNLPPGPPRLPFIGNLLQIAWINSTEPHIAFTKLGEIYGQIFSVKLGSVSAVVLNSFEVMEEYLHKPEFSDRYFNDWMAERTFNKRLGIAFASYPHPWNQLRRFSMRTLRDFGFGKRTKMHSIIQAELTEVVRELKTSIQENNGIQTFDNYFTISVLNVVWSMLTGRRFKHDDPKLVKLIKYMKEVIETVNPANGILLAFPQWKDWFPDWTGMTIQRRYFKETNNFFQEFVEERKILRIYKTCPENLVDEFLKEIDVRLEQHEMKTENEFTEQQLVAVMGDFFFAGSETTSNTMAWCILYLILNPEIQKKLQYEIDCFVPNGTFPDEEIESRLHYVRATLAETHRIGSVLPLAIPRGTTENTFCGNFLIPKGTYVIANLHGIHYDKSYWKDPESFRPERFLDENGKYKGDPRLKAFGFGKRICLGEPVASMSLTHYLTVLMQNFTFHLVPNEPLPSVQPMFGVTNGPQKYRALVECRY